MRKVIIAIERIILPAALVLSMVSCGISSSPEKTTEAYFSAVKGGDVETAIGYLTPAKQKQFKAAYSVSNTLLGGFGLGGLDTESILGAYMGTTNAEYYKNYEFKISEVTKTDDSHSIVYVDVYVDGELKTTTPMKCTKIDGKWYVE